MSLGHGTKVITDKLLFAYDMNSKKSFKGKPTTNIIADAGKDCATEYSGTSYPFVSQNITAQVQDAWSSTNNTFAMQFEGYREYVAGGTGGGNDGYPVMYIYFTDWSWASTLGISDYDWAYRDKTFTMPNPAGKTIYFAIYHMNSGNRGRSYARKFQIEQSDFVTPFVNGTRSNTESLLDWKGDSAITMNSLTYASDNTFSFNGSSNYLQTVSPLPDRYNWTIEFVAKQSAFVGGQVVLCPLSAGIDHSIRFNSSGKLYAIFTRIADNNAFSVTASGGSAVNKWAHYVVQRTPSNVKIYRNGVLEADSTQTGISAEWSGTWNVGQRGNSTGWLNGEIAIMRAYDKILSKKEVENNFNAIKGRFDI